MTDKSHITSNIAFFSKYKQKLKHPRLNIHHNMVQLMCKRKQEKFSQQNRISPERKEKEDKYFSWANQRIIMKLKDAKCSKLQYCVKKFQKSKQNYIP